MSLKNDKTHREMASVRDTVESIWIAIVLAFVLRAFMVEAFVIPTGSMAPRLLGEHWDLQCRSCGYEYAYGFGRDSRDLGGMHEPKAPPAARCPNCDYPYGRQEDFVSGGDRVLVMKYLYRFFDTSWGRPKPWDVVVFKNPQDNRLNYIKRLIGLPGETIEIVHGDVFVGDSPQGPWQIRRKPARAQEAMWQVVYDNDYRPNDQLLEAQNAVAPRWVARGSQWSMESFAGRQFSFAGGTEAAVEFRAPPETFLPHYGYNALRAEKETSFNPRIDVVTDLKLSYTYVPRQGGGVAMTLSSFDHVFRTELDSAGVAVLRYKPRKNPDGPWEEWGRKQLSPLKLGQAYDVAMTHVDMQVTLWLDGQPVLQSAPEQYPENHDTLKAKLAQGQVPLPLVQFSAAGGPCDLRHIKLMRDVFYTATPLSEPPAGPLGEYAVELMKNDKDGRLFVRDFYTASEYGQYGPRYRGWGVMNHAISLARHPEDPDLDEFFVLGDNSPQSLDGRGWTSASPSLRLRDKNGNPLYQLGTVPRYSLIGKAFFVYWPAGYRLPGLRLPVIPNVGKMRMIR